MNTHLQVITPCRIQVKILASTLLKSRLLNFRTGVSNGQALHYHRNGTVTSMCFDKYLKKRALIKP